jgi:16S rRNA (uracil1498-N3)-methyltransferase
MQRYFVAPENFQEGQVIIVGDDAHHIVKVMRSKAGDRFIASDGERREALVEITEIAGQQVSASIVEMLPMDNEPQVEVWIAQSMPKSDKMETVIQKCTEIGAAGFIPFLSERTVVQYDSRKEAKRLERWQKIAKEAAEQAHRHRIPAVNSPVSWKQLLQSAGEVDLALICYEKEDGLFIHQALRSAGFSFAVQGGKVLLIVGPEGGFTEQEVEQAAAAGCKCISLGKRILRTETAAMVGLTCILYESGEMGG